MAAMRYLLLAVTLACFIRGGLSVTDEEFKDLSHTVNAQALLIKQQASVISEQAAVIQQLQETDRITTRRVEKLESVAQPQQELVQNFTLEERVGLLEIQVADLDEDVDFLFDEQVIQDERLLNVEEASDSLNEEVEDLQDVTLELDFRVTNLEENGGSDGNSSISELEERVETLEGTAADHETRLTAAESEIEDLEGLTGDLETRITAAEENIQGLQMTDISLDARITALEENGGGGSQNETIAFHAVLTSYDSISTGQAIDFDVIVTNEGNGYDSTTGVFTVPLGGGGLYYFYTYLSTDDGEYGRYEIEHNDEVVCAAEGDSSNTGNLDFAQATCSAVLNVVEGDEVKVVLGSGDTTPLHQSSTIFYNGFNGFRI